MPRLFNVSAQHLTPVRITHRTEGDGKDAVDVVKHTMHAGPSVAPGHAIAFHAHFTFGSVGNAVELSWLPDGEAERSHWIADLTVATTAGETAAGEPSKIPEHQMSRPSTFSVKVFTTSGMCSRCGSMASALR